MVQHPSFPKDDGSRKWPDCAHHDIGHQETGVMRSQSREARQDAADPPAIEFSTIFLDLSRAHSDRNRALHGLAGDWIEVGVIDDQPVG